LPRKTIAKIVNFFSDLLHRKSKYPVYGNCAVCDKKVYLPFHCEYCNRFFCGTHRLPFNHSCKNIKEYNQAPASAGVVTESREGKIRVWK
jgi:predicted nucleic acid binding AN1-type Zn finger protein